MEPTQKVKERGVFKHMYRATRRAYFSVLDWGKLGKAIQKSTGKAVLADFNGRVSDALDSGTFQHHNDAVLYWLGLQLDDESWPEFVKILSWTIEEVQELAKDTVRRNANREGSGQAFPVTFGIVGFESPVSKPGEKHDDEFRVSPDQMKDAQQGTMEKYGKDEQG